jgi:PLP dependent protein
MNIEEKIKKYKGELPSEVTLVAVSKTKSPETILKAYNTGQRIFGENKIQEMEGKYETLPKDIEWHMIGHVQTNKVKYMAPFVSLIHAVDRMKLLKEINKQAKKHDRVIPCLLQIKIAEEDSKFGLSEEKAESILNSETLKELSNISIVGVMGMATFTDDLPQVRKEFRQLKQFFDKQQPSHPNLSIISMGMSGDYEIAIEEGSNMVRLGSSIFGPRES